MKRYRLTELPDVKEGHFLKGIVPGEFICRGTLGYKPPGSRTHDHDAPDGSDRHVHDECEVFILLQGRATMQIDGVGHPMTTGDVIVVEPGEDHHLVSDENDPCINLWLHAGDRRHPDQTN